MHVRTIVLIMLLIGVAVFSFAANRYAVASGSWDATSTWSATSGGAPGASIPIAGDIVYIGEGTGSYVVTVPGEDPPIPHACSQIIMGSSTGNAASAYLDFANINSLLTVTGSVTIYNSTAAVIRHIHVGHGNLTVNGNVYLSMPGSFTEHANSEASIGITHGTMTAMDFIFYAAAGSPLKSKLEFTGIGILNLYGNLLLPNGGGTLIPGAGTVAFLGSTQQTINGVSNITFYHLKVNNPVGVFLTGLVSVDGVWTQLNGSVTGTLPTIDGYSSVEYNHIAIAQDDNHIVGFQITMTTPILYPVYINREWHIAGNYTGNKTYSFYWEEADDEDHNWAGEEPIVWKDTSLTFVGPYQVVTIPKYIDVIMPAMVTESTYNIGWIEQTVPVELSSFTAIATPQNFVKLDWVTQTETGVSGYYILRNSTNDLQSAQIVSPLVTATNTSQQQSYTFTDSEVDQDTYYYWLQNLEMNGSSNYYGSLSVTITDEETPGTPVVPLRTVLENVYPNPFKPFTTISYFLAKAEKVEIGVFNIKGQNICTLVSESKQAGVYRINWNGKDSQGRAMPSGVYYVKMTAGEYICTQKAILLK